MAVAFKRGGTTGPADLATEVRNTSGTLIDPFRIQYAVFDYTTGIEILQGSPVCYPVKISTGKYYAQVNIPAEGNIGDWRIRWTYQETAADPVYQSVQEFNVVGDSTVVSFSGDENIDKLVFSLRILLGDNNPDRLYSVSGDEEVELKIGEKSFVVSLKDLWKIIEDGKENRL